jgi:hypothetical protein
VRLPAVWDAAVADAGDGGLFVRNAIRQNGREREIIAQALKSAFAAVLAWTVASRLLALPLPYIAPLSAMLMVSATVYCSVLSGVRRVIAVAVGVVLALLVATWAPSKELALAIVLPVTLLLGQRRRLGDQCLYAAFAALFMITFGQPEGGYVLSRLAETGLGVIIGTAINLLIFPPVHIRSVRDAAQRAATAASELQRDIASALTSNWDEQDARDWARRAECLDDRTYELREALRWGRESSAVSTPYAASPARPNQDHPNRVDLLTFFLVLRVVVFGGSSGELGDRGRHTDTHRPELHTRPHTRPHARRGLVVER